MNQTAQRARLLMAQSRWEMARGELLRGLADDGENAELHSLLALCLARTKQYDDAETEARSAVGMAPDSPLTHRVLAAVLFDRRKYSAAGAAAEQAIALDPSDVDAHGILGQIRYAQEDWQGMLAAAEMGLALDPENTNCNNLRATALVKLGRRAEAGQTLEAALARDPENPLTHANQGWTLLETGQHAQALDHFRESLTFDPNMQWGRAGIVEALKSRNFVYRWLLRYFLYMSRLSSRARWGIIVGAFILQRILLSYATEHPEAGPYVWPVLAVYAVFALMTWLAYPLFNLLLLTDKLGRRALTANQRWQALSVGGILLSAILLAAGTAIFDSTSLTFLGYDSAFSIAALSIPALCVFACSAGWPRWVMLGATAGLAALAVVPLGCRLYTALWPHAPAAPVVAAFQFWDNWFVLGLVGSQFLALSLVSVKPVR